MFYALNRHYNLGNSQKKAFNWALLSVYRGLLHYYHSKKHTSVHADMVPEK